MYPSTLRPFKFVLAYYIFERVLGVVGQFFQKVQTLMEIREMQNGCFSHPFFDVYWYPCSLTLPPPHIGWEIIGYESDPFPSYRCLRNPFYIIILKTKVFSGLHHLPSHFLIPPPHESDGSRNIFLPIDGNYWVINLFSPW